MKLGELEYAQRRARNMFNKWNNVTGIFIKHTGYYYEILSVIDDAVEIGVQEALQEYKQLESEKDLN